VIVEARVVAQASLEALAVQLRSLLVGQRLGGFAAAATSDGEAVLMRAGVGGISKQIAVQALEPTYGPNRVVIPMRWVATGVAGELFPALDGNLELRRLEDGTAELVLIGSYRPPLGRTGEVLDQLLLRRVARRTVESFVEHLAAALVDPRPAPMPRLELRTDP
jgi:hypothetical protein